MGSTRVENSLLSLTDDAEEVPGIVSKLVLNRRSKADLKDKFLSLEENKLFYEYLGKDPETWPSLRQADDALKQSSQRRRQIREDLEAQKTKIQDLCEKAKEYDDSRQEVVRKLNDRIKLYNDKKEKFQNLLNKHKDFLKTTDLGEISTAIQTCEATVKKLEQQKQQGRALNHKLTKAVTDAMIDLQQMGTGRNAATNAVKDRLDRQREQLSFLEKMDGLKEHAVGEHKIQLEFLQTGADDLRLFLTMTLREDYFGCPQLVDAKLNIDNFNIDDILAVAVKENDIPYLVQKVRQRWQQHYPLLSEMEDLLQNHAVDWIEEDGLLRVLVGKSGSVMFTLKVPSGYPSEGEVTLVNVYGLSDSQAEEVQGLPGAATLKEWVQHLETQFGST